MYSIRPLSGNELTGSLLAPVLEVFAAALDYRRDHPRVTGMVSILQRHADRAGLRAFGAFETEPRERLVGFGYGYSSQPGLWWREQITPALSPAQREYWLADAFELAELHVAPPAQGHKLGSRLHDMLMAEVPHRTALLSVMHRSQRARLLYQRRGWQTLVQTLYFSSDPSTPFSVLGLELPGRRTPSP